MTGAYPKVLVGTVTYEGKDYIQEEHEHAIQSFKYPNYDRLVVDNSRGTSYRETLRRRGVTAVTVERGDHSYEAIANAYNKLWEYAKRHDYDYLLTVESDLLPEKDTIDRLLMHDKDIVGSWYFLGAKDAPSGFQPCIMVDKEAASGQVGSKLLGRRETEGGKNILHKPTIKQWLNTGLRKCHGCGFGCTLISRRILDAFDFIDYISYGEGDESGKKHADSWFFFQCRNNGIQPYVDTDRIVEHHPSDWSEVPDRY